MAIDTTVRRTPHPYFGAKCPKLNDESVKPFNRLRYPFPDTKVCGATSRMQRMPATTSTMPSMASMASQIVWTHGFAVAFARAQAAQPGTEPYGDAPRQQVVEAGDYRGTAHRPVDGVRRQTAEKPPKAPLPAAPRPWPGCTTRWRVCCSACARTSPMRGARENGSNDGRATLGGASSTIRRGVIKLLPVLEKAMRRAGRLEPLCGAMTSVPTFCDSGVRGGTRRRPEDRILSYSAVCHFDRRCRKALSRLGVSAVLHRTA